jgi:DHA2 family multidrug resistance protein
VGEGDVLWTLVFRGLGLGFLFVPINAAVLSQFEGAQLGQAAGLLNLSRQIGGSVGIAGIATYLDRYGAQLRNDLRAHVSFANPSAVQALQAAGSSLKSKLSTWHGLSPGTVGLHQDSTLGMGSVQGRMEAQVFQLSFNRIMVLILTIYMLSIIPIFTMKLKKKVTGAAQAH